MAATDALNTYTQQLYDSLMKNAPQINYTARPEAQLRDNLENAYRASYDQSVRSRQQTTRQNRAAIDADAAARGIGASTWVTDAKLRQGDREASDLASLASNRRSTIAQQLASAMSDQEDRRLSANQYNAQIKANMLNNALSAAGSMYDTFKAEEGAAAGGGGSSGGSSGGGNNPYYKPAGSSNTTDSNFGAVTSGNNLSAIKSALNSLPGNNVGVKQTMASAVKKATSTASSYAKKNGYSSGR